MSVSVSNIDYALTDDDSNQVSKHQLSDNNETIHKKRDRECQNENLATSFFESGKCKC